MGFLSHSVYLSCTACLILLFRAEPIYHLVVFFFCNSVLSYSRSTTLILYLGLESFLAAAMAMSFRGLSRPNASCAMAAAEHSKNTFMELQRKKVHRYVIFKVDEKKREVVVEKIGGPAESYDDFVAALPENDCRYAVYDFDFVTSDNCQKSKIFFIAWSPSTSRIRAKMLYATSKDQFRRELDGIHYEIQATDPTEMDLEVIRERAH